MLSFSRSRYLEEGVSVAVTVNDFQLVKTEKTAKRPIAWLTVRLFAWCPSTRVPTDARKTYLPLSFVSFDTSAHERVHRLHCAAHRARERAVISG